MIRFAGLVILALVPACAHVKTEQPGRAYAGTVQKVFKIVRQGEDLPGMRLLGKVGQLIGPALRQSSETHQYVVRTRTGQITAQSDDEFSVGDCVEVVPQSDTSGPAFRYGQAQVRKAENCTT